MMMMTEKKVIELIKYFATRGSFEENIWSQYKFAKTNLLMDSTNPFVSSSLINALRNSEETTVIYCVEILADIGNEMTIPPIEKIEFRPDVILFSLYCSNAIKILKSKSTFNLLEFSKKSTEELIGIFAKHGNENSGSKRNFIFEEHYYAKKILIERGNNILDKLFNIISTWERIASDVDFNSVLFQNEDYCRTKTEKLCNILNEIKISSLFHILDDGEKEKTCFTLYSILLMLDSLVAESAEVLGEIGNKSAIYYLKKILRHYCTGMTSRKAASALVKLQDKSGYDFLVERVRNSNISPEVRIKCAAELYYLGLKNIFEKTEVIDLSERPGQDLTILKKLVGRLRDN
jgi:hypothetical protein